jgi:hypothetical protein
VLVREFDPNSQPGLWFGCWLFLSRVPCQGLCGLCLSGSSTQIASQGCGSSVRGPCQGLCGLCCVWEFDPNSQPGLWFGCWLFLSRVPCQGLCGLCLSGSSTQIASLGCDSGVRGLCQGLCGLCLSGSSTQIASQGCGSGVRGPCQGLCHVCGLCLSGSSTQNMLALSTWDHWVQIITETPFSGVVCQQIECEAKFWWTTTDSSPAPELIPFRRK